MKVSYSIVILNGQATSFQKRFLDYPRHPAGEIIYLQSKLLRLNLDNNLFMMKFFNHQSKADDVS